MKNKTLKRTLSMLIAVLMVVSCMTALFTFSASAEGLSFDWVKEWTTVDGTASNAVYQEKKVVPSDEQFKYDYAISYVGKYYKVAVKYYGTLTGVAPLRGNGNGTNVRIWLRDAATEYVSYNWFLDVAYDDGKVATRFFKNTYPAGNTSSVIYNYDLASYPYKVNFAATEYGADFEVIITMPEISETVVEKMLAIISVSNKINTNYCLHSNQNIVAPANKWTEGSIETECKTVYTKNVVPKYYTLEKIPATSENVFAAGVTEGYNGNVTDGVAPAEGYSTSDWYGMHQGSYIALDLGEVRDDVAAVSVFLWPHNKSGIKAPDAITVYASEDGEEWEEISDFDVSDPSLKESGASSLWLTSVFFRYVKVRYIRIVPTGGWTFIGEVEVQTAKEVTAFDMTSTYEYTIDSANYITSLQGKTLDDINPDKKNHEWWNFASIEWDNKKGEFVVTAVYKGTGDKLTTDFGDLETPDLGALIGAHQTGANKAFAEWIGNLKVGQTVYVYFDEGVDISGAAGPIEGITVSEKEFFGGESLYIEGKDVKTIFGYATADSTVFVRVNDKTTVSAVYESISGKAKDYHAYALVAVDKDGKVVAKNMATGETDDKTEFEIPEDGFVLGAHTDNTRAINALNKLYIGDTVRIYNLPENPAAETADLTNVYYISTHTHSHEPTVVAPTCKDDGYTEYVCVCGDSYKQDYVSATGTHNYIPEDKGNYVLKTCDVCGDKIYEDKDGNALTSIKVSHHNAYSWAAFEAMIISGGSVQQKVNQTCQWWICYIVENIDGKYIATRYQKNDAANATTVAPDGGFLLFVYSSDSAYTIVDNEAILGCELILADFDLSSGMAIDSKANPNAVKHIVIAPAAPDPIQPEEKVALPEGAISLDNAGYVHGNYNCIMKVDEDTTIGAFTEIFAKSAKDMNYFNVIIVNEEGKVTYANNVLGRPDGVKTDAVIPAGSYIIGVNGNKAADYAASKEIKVGDTINLYNINIDATVGLTEKVDLTQAGFTYEPSVAYRLGDVDGDGVIAENDYIQLRLAILGLIEINEQAEGAADVNGDGIIDVMDYIGIRLHLLGIKAIAE